jgi:hypothetical protein
MLDRYRGLASGVPARADCPPSAYAEDEWLRHRNSWGMGGDRFLRVSGGLYRIGFLHGVDFGLLVSNSPMNGDCGPIADPGGRRLPGAGLAALSHCSTLPRLVSR